MFVSLRHLVGSGCAVGLAVLGYVPLGGAGQAPGAGPRVEISFPAAARSEPVTGMVYVAISRDNQRTPIEQTDPTGVPLFSHAVDALAPGATVVIGASDRGHPVATLRDIPAGDYWMEPFVNVYTRFARADGHTVWMHMDQWEGQNWKRSPGNLYGEPVKVHFDPSSSAPIRLVADKVIPPVQVPPDTALVKRIKIQSQILTKWWGQPIYLGATVLLPKDYDTHPEVHYPVNYSQGHFSLGAPGGFGRGGPFDKYWLADGTPRMIYVTLQHPSPYYDDSYSVNSANNGPYGDAIMQELIPAIETKFRVIRQPWARMLSGGSTGGWIALAQQIFYPDFYGGTFASCPDSVDFDYHQIVNVYKDANAYFLDKGWMQVERPNVRRPDGNIQSMMKDENHYELTVGDHSRSGGQWDIWEATYSPVGDDGYPKRIWDKETGAIDHAVAEQWKKYDLLNVLKTNWPTLGPKVADKINVYVGDMDTYYLNDAVENLYGFLSKAENPKWTGEIVFQRRAPHCWGPRGEDLLQKLVKQIDTHAPAGADLTSWKY
ncbi:MAG TPA: alpha/beta hydrolase-fold protein [Vicinamibacterales bacterium]|nr:alpha/beta hydrolase-fold protein [Vicinamibacterales bacterium]